MLKTESWWVGVDREKWRQEIAKREEEWKRQRVGFLDNIGHLLMRDQWEPGPSKKFEPHG